MTVICEHHLLRKNGLVYTCGADYVVLVPLSEYFSPVCCERSALVGKHGDDSWKRLVVHSVASHYFPCRKRSVYMDPLR